MLNVKKIYFLILILILVITAFGIYSLYQKYVITSSNVSKSNVTLYFTGDVMLGRGVDNLLGSGQNVFRDVDPLFLNSDGAIVNLEDPLTTSTTNFKLTVPLKANPKYTYELKDNNVIVTCLANNHIMDYGDLGLNNTISALQSNGLKITQVQDKI